MKAKDATSAASSRRAALAARLGFAVAVTAASAWMIASPAGPAFAHEQHGHAEHGGVVAEAGAFQGELVAKGGTLTLYLTDHGQPIATQGANARMTMLTGGKKSDLLLAPAGGNRLAATGAPVPGAGAKAVASVKLPDGRSGALRFEWK